MRAELRNFEPGKNYIAPIFICANLIAFGEEIYAKYLNSGHLYLRFQTEREGIGFIAYKIESNKILVSEIFIQAVNLQSKRNIYESLLYTLRNIGASLNYSIVFESLTENDENFFRYYNQLLKEQKIDEKYWWILTDIPISTPDIPISTPAVT